MDISGLCNVVVGTVSAVVCGDEAADDKTFCFVSPVGVDFVA